MAGAAGMESAYKGHPVWEGFTAETRRQLIEKDLVAWRRVCTVLLTIISCGLLLGITAVLICVG